MLFLRQLGRAWYKNTSKRIKILLKRVLRLRKPVQLFSFAYKIYSTSVMEALQFCRHKNKLHYNFFYINMCNKYLSKQCIILVGENTPFEIQPLKLQF